MGSAINPLGTGEVPIRDAIIDDADRIGQIAVDAWNYAYTEFMTPEFMAARSDPARRAQRIREGWGQERYRLVALSPEGEVVGFAWEERPCTLEGYDGEIGALYVDPKYSRGGVGRALVSEMARRFRALGFRSMAIHTLVQNRIGCSFYEKIGGKDGPLTVWYDYPGKWYVWDDLDSFGTVRAR